MDLSAKYGAYCATFVTMNDSYVKVARFKNRVATLTAADCMAAVNALHILSNNINFEYITDVILVTDSGKVEKMLTVYKAEKHCEQAAERWRKDIQPRYANKNFTIRKSKAAAGTNDGYALITCENAAANELKKFKQLLT